MMPFAAKNLFALDLGTERSTKRRFHDEYLNQKNRKGFALSSPRISRIALSDEYRGIISHRFRSPDADPLIFDVEDKLVIVEL